MRYALRIGVDGRALEQLLFGLALAAGATTVLLAIYYLGFRGRDWSSIASACYGLAVAAAVPALAGLLIRHRRQNG